MIGGLKELLEGLENNNPGEIERGWQEERRCGGQ
jgi:hypothetical protein